jgi:excisionase family DNA binding protein
MTSPRLSIKPVLVSPGRRRRGAGEPAPLLVPPPVELVAPWLLDSREVSRVLGIGRTKAFQMMARAELPVVRLGRCVRVPRAALQIWIGDQVRTVAPDSKQRTQTPPAT